MPRHPMLKNRSWSKAQVIRISQAIVVAISAQAASAESTLQERVPASVARQAAFTQRSAQMVSLVEAAAQRHQLDPALLLALIDVESSFRTSAVSPKGARGLMQLMPDTASRYGLRRSIDLHDPATNVEIGARHLKDLLDSSDGNLTLALASYNAGQGAIRRSGNTIPSYRETMLYVPAILGRIPVFQDLLRLNP